MIRFISTLLSFAFIAPAFAEFPDVTDAHENDEAVAYVEEHGIVSGYPDGNFRPDITINRAEFLKIVTGAVFTKEVIDGCIKGAMPVFPDVPADAWFAKYVCTGKVYGIIQGYPDGTFHPEQPISFVEAAKIITVALKLNEGIAPGDVWYEHYVRILASKKAVPISVNHFDKQLSRGEVAEIIWRVNVANTMKPDLSYEDIVLIESDPVAFYVSKLGDESFKMRYGDGQAWHEAPEQLGMIGKEAIVPLIEALESNDDYTISEAFYALLIASQHPSVSSFTGGSYPAGAGNSIMPASEYDALKAEWKAWFQKYAMYWGDENSIIQLYLIEPPDQSDGEGPIGCGDRMVAVTRTIPHTQSILTAAITSLINLKQINVDGKYNALGNATLTLESVKVEGGKATIRLNGEMNIGGICDAPRVQAQIEYTAKQFTSVQWVDIFLNGEPLSEALGGR
jgi:hypothetical protein